MLGTFLCVVIVSTIAFISCNLISVMIRVADGKWSEWSPWTKCSMPCGGGLQRRTRSCDNPRPAHGGRFCSGDSREAQRCNQYTCSGEKKLYASAVHISLLYNNNNHNRTTLFERRFPSLKVNISKLHKIMPVMALVTRATWKPENTNPFSKQEN